MCKIKKLFKPLICCCNIVWHLMALKTDDSINTHKAEKATCKRENKLKNKIHPKYSNAMETLKLIVFVC